MQMANPESQVRFRLNVFGMVQKNQLRAFIAVGARVALQLEYPEHSGLIEPVFHL